MPRRPPAAAAQETRTARSERTQGRRLGRLPLAGVKRRMRPVARHLLGVLRLVFVDALTRRPAEASGPRRSYRAVGRSVCALRCGRSLHQEKSGPLATAWMLACAQFTAVRLGRTAAVARRPHSARAIVPTGPERRCLWRHLNHADRGGPAPGRTIAFAPPDRRTRRRARLRNATVPIVAPTPVAVTAGDHRTVCSPQPAAADRRPRIRGVAPPRRTNLARPTTPISLCCFSFGCGVVPGDDVRPRDRRQRCANRTTRGCRRTREKSLRAASLRILAEEPDVDPARVPEATRAPIRRHRRRDRNRLDGVGDQPSPRR